MRGHTVFSRNVSVVGGSYRQQGDDLSNFRNALYSSCACVNIQYSTSHFFFSLPTPTTTTILTSFHATWHVHVANLFTNLSYCRSIRISFPSHKNMWHVGTYVVVKMWLCWIIDLTKNGVGLYALGMSDRRVYVSF